jgi:Pyruvate/2-oxoacid:ferredoxin oxidoreductase gamma subunit
MRNLYVLGVASNLDIFPIDAESIKQAIKETAKKGLEKESLEVFESAQMVIKKEKLAV